MLADENRSRAATWLLLGSRHGGTPKAIAAEMRPQHGVGRYPVVEPVDERFDRAMASDALEKITADEGAMRLRVGKESTMLHCVLASRWRSERAFDLPFHSLWIKEVKCPCPSEPLVGRKG